MFFFTFQEAVAEDDEDANTYLVVSPSASGKNMNVTEGNKPNTNLTITCLLYTSPSPRDRG